jgi:hypothetical protein
MVKTSEIAEKLKKIVNEGGEKSTFKDSDYKLLIKELLSVCEKCDFTVFTNEDNSGSGLKEKVKSTYLIDKIDDCVIRTLKYIIYCLQNGYINPDKFLIWLIVSLEQKKVKDPAEGTYRDNVLLLMSFCLRYGADPNMYIMEPNMGKIHLIVFTIKRFEEMNLLPYGEVKNDFTKQILLLFCLLGSKVAFKATYAERMIDISNAKANRKIVEEARKRVNPEVENATVRDLLNGVGFDTKKDIQQLTYVYSEPYEDPYYILNQQTDSSGPKQNEFVINFGYLIDDPKYALINSNNSVYINFDKVLRHNAIKVLQSTQIDDDANEIKFRHESIRLIQTIECIALEAFVELLRRGTKMSYFTMNRLLLKIISYTKKDSNYNRIYSEVYIAMLKSALSLGVPMDKYQFDFIQRVDLTDSDNKKIKDTIETIYKQPLYKKTCETSIKAEVPKSIKLLSASLGVGIDLSSVYYDTKRDKTILSEPTKQEICSGIYSIMNQEKSKFLTDAKDRLTKRIEFTTPKLDDYAKGRVTGVDCKNKGGIYGDPLDYNDSTLVYYRDKNEDLYCFPANMYKELALSKKNPITDEDLPMDVLVKISKASAIFKTMGINPDNMLTVEDAYTKLKDVDSFDKAKTEYAMETVKLLFLSRGIKPIYLQELSIDSLNKMLDVSNVKMAQDYLKQFSTDKPFAFATFCKALYSSIKDDDKIELIPDIISTMIAALKSPQTAPEGVVQVKGLSK